MNCLVELAGSLTGGAGPRVILLERGRIGDYPPTAMERPMMERIT